MPDDGGRDMTTDLHGEEENLLTITIFTTFLHMTNSPSCKSQVHYDLRCARLVQRNTEKAGRQAGAA